MALQPQKPLKAMPTTTSSKADVVEVIPFTVTRATTPYTVTVKTAITTTTAITPMPKLSMGGLATTPSTAVTVMIP